MEETRQHNICVQADWLLQNKKIANDPLRTLIRWAIWKGKIKKMNFNIIKTKNYPAILESTEHKIVRK